jgi:hypothetical protein
MSFSFPNVGLDTNFNGVENGGLFTRDQCRQLAKYFKFNLEKLLKHMMGIMMVLLNQSKLLNGFVIAIEQ